MSETRKLAAILVADVVGYSRLAGADEDRTLARLRGLRSDLIDPAIAAHHGRIVKRTGDGSIIEFRSVVDAVRCAIEVQNGMVERNAGVPEDRRIQFRVGIHLGDIVEESDGDLMGDGVNIAARLQSVAKPGAICLSEDAYRQVRQRLDIKVTDLGATTLKNIAQPVRVYSLEVGQPAETKPASATTAGVKQESATPAPRASGWSSRWPALAAIALLLLAAASGWALLGGRLTKPAQAAHLSIVALPFANLSGDPSQDYFADGITENLTTELSRIRNSFVIARNTAFTYKGKGVDAKEIGKELGVRYVLEGSVQRDQNRVRVNAQLIDAETGAHQWADRFEDELSDLFMLEDQIVARLANSLRVELITAESRRAVPQKPDAIDLTMRGWALMYQRPTKENIAAARNFFEQALTIDPDNADALAGVAYSELRDFAQGYEEPNIDYSTRVFVPAERAIAISPTTGMAYYAKGVYLFLTNQPKEAIATAQAGLERNPNLAPLYFVLSGAQLPLGNFEQAKTYIERAMRLSPRDAQIGIWRMLLGEAEVGLGDYDAAVEQERMAVDAGYGPYQPYMISAAAYALAGQDDKARSALVQAQRQQPGLTSMKWVIAHTPRQLRLFDGLRKAGLPEE
jgi:adenylate cyclase